MNDEELPQPFTTTRSFKLTLYLVKVDLMMILF